MTKSIQRSNERGKADHGWLKAQHSFSFGSYYNPEKMNFGALRVINEDRIAAGMGFATHPHDNMEIITVPLKGALKHKDSMGNEYVIRAGEIQVMSAGTGITHSEYNNSQDEEVHLLQIWVQPNQRGVTPGYGQKEFPKDEAQGKLQLLVSDDGRDESLKINQKAFFSRAFLSAGEAVHYQKKDENNGVYLFLIEGEVKAGEDQLSTGDALSLENVNELKVESKGESSLLIIEVPL